MAVDHTRKKERLHFIGICGKAMGGIATALQREGWAITGSDESPYPPMSDYLRDCGIEISLPEGETSVPANIAMAIVGKRTTEANPDLQYVLENQIPFRSFPQLLHERFLRHSRNIVVTGALGKTTTTAMLAWILEHAGTKPDYLIGGFARNFSAPARFAQSALAVLEGDEYASCFNDPKPKFLYYRPEVAVITNILEDHPDLYGGFEAVRNAFSALMETLPTKGCLIVPERDPTAVQLADSAQCKVLIVGTGESATMRIHDLTLHKDRSCFQLKQCQFEVPVCGEMNVIDAAFAAVAALQVGIDLEESAKALRLFRGVANRQEEKKVGRYTFVTDKASHPYALGELARALRQRFPGQRLVSVMQPRATGGRSWIYQSELPSALSNFDKIILTHPYEHNPPPETLWRNDPFQLDLLVSDLTSLGADLTVAATIEDLPETIAGELKNGDVIVLTLPEQYSHFVATIEEALEKSLEQANI
jgi:UDP-N-acetylmuramate: L-alanyl-gamma-D-glutamyl-meso-diaminopimelate ligase